MVKLYKYNEKTKNFEFVDIGVASKAETYTQLGYIVEYE